MRDEFTLTLEWKERIERICTQYELGELRNVVQAAHGRNNLVLIVNDLYVLRFDNLKGRQESRFEAEKWAYDLLVDSGMPVPRALAVDTSRQIVPSDYLVMTHVPGVPLITVWPALSAEAREHVASQIGNALARMHIATTNSFDGRFGRLRKLNTRPLTHWVQWADDFYGSYRKCADERGTIPAALLRDMDAAYARHRPLLEQIRVGSLVHTDAHFENWLVDGEKVAGLVDFEWCVVGDPSSDFQVEEQWEDGLDAIYTAYEKLRPLDAGHPIRVAIHKMLRHFDSAVESKEFPEDNREQQAYDDAIREIEAALSVLR